MTAREPIEEKLENLSRAIGADDSLVENVMNRIDAEAAESHRIRNLKNKLILRRFIMNRFIKLTAAAIIIVVLLWSFLLLFESTGVVYGITDLPTFLNEAKTLHIKGSQTYYLKGQKFISCPIEYWMDFENGRYRKRGLYRRRTNNGGFAKDYYKDEEVVFDTTYIMVINHTEKTVRFGRQTPFRSRFLLRAHGERDEFLRDFYLGSNQLDGFKKTAQEDIDGVVFDVWEKKVERPWQRTTRYWIDPDTGELGRYSDKFLYDRYFSVEKKIADRYSDGFVLLDEDEHERHENVLNCVERDKPLPYNIFTLEAPSGYKIVRRKEEAPEPGDIGYQTFPQLPNITVSLRYTISEDGSVILAWSDRNVPAESQADLFEKLKRGGPLPELTFVPYALHPMFSVFREKNESITYVGHHLAYTRKGDVYYEWSIYVPDSETPESEFKHRLTYDGLVRRNPDDGQTRGMGLIPDTIITSAEDFDALVLGAMAELSDDGKAPKGITYDGVLELAEQIRVSMEE